MGFEAPLHQDQKKKLGEIAKVLEKDRRVLLTGSLGVGKSLIGLVYALEHAPSVLVCSSYQAVDELLDTVQRLFPKKDITRLQIVKPEGRRRACSIPGCIHSTRKRYKGQMRGIITKERIQDADPGACPYATLKGIAESTDGLVITHHAVLTKSLRLRRKKLLVIDECDELFRPRDYLLVRYAGPKESPMGVEADNVSQIRLDLRSLFHNPPGDTAERREEARKRIQKCVDIVDRIRKEALTSAQGADLSDRVAKLNSGMIQDVKEGFAALKRSDLRELPPDRLENADEFRGVAANIFKFHYRSAQPSTSSPQGYQEVRMSDRMPDVSAGFESTLLISATPSLIDQKVPVVSFVDQSNLSNVMFVRFSHRDAADLHRLFYGLMKYNILGVTTSQQRARRRRAQLGGMVVPDEWSDTLEWELVVKKGKLVWNYYGSPSSKSVNRFSVFDGVVVTEWISRDTAQYEEEESKQTQSAVNNMVQMIGRVLRPMPNGRMRRKFVIVFDKDAFRLLKGSYKGSRFQTFDEVKPLLDRIKEFAPPHPGHQTWNPVRSKRGKMPTERIVGRKTRQRFLWIPLPKGSPKTRYKTVLYPIPD